MSDVLQRAKTHFSALRKELKCIEVPEWKDEQGTPSKIYYKSSMTLAQSGEVMRLKRDDPGKSLAQTFIYRALDENGKNLFKQSNIIELMRNVDPDVMGSILIKMEETEEELETLKED